MVFKDEGQSGLRARTRVAEVGSGRKRNSTSAGGLHIVQFFTWLGRRTKRLSQPIAGPFWAAASYPGRAITAIGKSLPKVAEPTVTPWNSLNARLEGPGGVQLTLFTELDG